MNQAKNIQQKQATDLKEDERLDKLNRKNNETNETISTEANTKEGALKPTHKISKNIHVEPAGEQQLKNELYTFSKKILTYGIKT